MEIKNIKKLLKSQPVTCISKIFVLIMIMVNCSSKFTKQSQFQLRDPNTRVTAFSSDKQFFVYAANNSKIHCHKQGTYIGSLSLFFMYPLSTVQLIKIRKNDQDSQIQLLFTMQYLLYSWLHFFILNLNFQVISSLNEFNDKITTMQIGNQYLYFSTVHKIMSIYRKNFIIFQKLRHQKKINKISQITKQNQTNVYVGFESGELDVFSVYDVYQKDIVGRWNFQEQQLLINSTVIELISEKRGIQNGDYYSWEPILLHPFGNAGFFDNKSHLVFSDFSFPNNSFTFTGWIHPFQITQYYPIISNTDWFTGITLMVAESQIQLLVSYNGVSGSQQTLNITGPVMQNLWNFISFTIDFQAKIVKLFVNSQLVSSETVNAEYFNIHKQPFFIGKQTINNLNFYGYLDQFKFFNRLLSPQEIQFHNQGCLQAYAISIFNNTLTGIHLSKTSGQIFLSNVDGKIKVVSVQKTYMNPASITLKGSFQPFRAKINSILQITDGNKSSLIVSSDSFRLKQFSRDNFSQVWSQNIDNESTMQSVFLSSLYQNKFFSVRIGQSRLIRWSIFITQSCHQSCKQCALQKNQTQCYQCQDFYQKIKDESALKGFRCVRTCPQQYNQINGSCQIRNQILASGVTVVASVMSMPNARFIAKLIAPFLTLIEDLWFYKYHDRNQSAFMEYVFQEIQRINQIKIAPDFSHIKDLDNSLLALSTTLEQHYQKFISQFLKGRGFKSNAFLSNAKQILVYGFLSSLGCCFLIVSMILVIQYYNEQTQYQILKKLIKFLDKNCGWAFLIAGFIETNLLSLSFYCFNQLTVPFCSRWVDKMNIMCTVLCLFVLIIYSCCFYILTYKFCSKIRAQNLLKYEQFSYLTFWQCMHLYSFKNLLKGFLHGFLTHSYVWQICSLALTNLMEIIITIYFRKCYEEKIYLLLVLGYQISFQVLNCIFLTYCFVELQQYITKQNAQISQQYIVFSMTGFIILLIISLIILPIYRWYQSKQSKRESITTSVKTMNEIKNTQQSNTIKDKDRKVKFQVRNQNDSNYNQKPIQIKYTTRIKGTAKNIFDFQQTNQAIFKFEQKTEIPRKTKTTRQIKSTNDQRLRKTNNLFINFQEKK